MANTLTRMARFTAPYKWRLFFFFFTAIGCSVFTSVPVLLIRQFLSLLIESETSAAAVADQFWTYVLLLVLVELVRAYFIVRREVAQLHLSQYVVRDATNRVAEHVLMRPLAFFDRWRSGDLITRATIDAYSLTVTVRVFTTFIREPLTMLAVTGTLLYMNWRLTLLVLAALPFAVLPIAAMSRRIRSASRRMREAGADRADAMVQVLGGVRVVKGFDREDLEAASFAATNDRIFGESMKRGRATAGIKGIVEIVGAAGIILVFVMGFLMIPRGLTTAAELLTFIIALATFGGPLKSLGFANSVIQDALPGAERLFSLLDADDALYRPDNPVPAVRPEHSIELKGSEFSYGRDEVLRGVDLEIRAGQATAIVGPSGSGKSTVLNLIARFYDPTAGRVLVDGTDLKEIDHDGWLAQIGLVTQEPFLFNASVRDNIRYGRPDATDEDVERAARAANVHDDITAFEGGYDALAGERGSQMSGGQRQRICLARALIRDPAILLLDEATSSLDSASEREVQAAIERAQAGRTSVVVAHRLSTIMNAERIYVIANGTVEAAGTHGELLETSATYQHLWQIQQGADLDGSPPPGDVPADTRAPA